MLTREELKAVVQQMKAEGRQIKKHIVPKQCFILSYNKHRYSPEVGIRFTNIVFPCKLQDVHLNASSNIYELWGMIQEDGVFLDHYLLLTPEQGIHLENKFFEEEPTSTIIIPPYPENVMKDLQISYECSGEKISPISPEKESFPSEHFLVR